MCQNIDFDCIWQLLVMISTHSHVPEHSFYIVFYSYSCWYQPTPMWKNIDCIAYFTTTCVRTMTCVLYFAATCDDINPQTTPMCQIIDLILYFTATCNDINPLSCVRTLILYCIWQLLVMISTQSHVSEHWFYMFCYSYLWWYQPTPMCQNIDLILKFTAICDDINPLSGVRTLILFCNSRLLVMISTYSPASPHWFYIVLYNYLWRYQPTPRRHYIDFMLCFTAACDDINPFQVPEHRFDIVIYSYLWWYQPTLRHQNIDFVL